VQDPVATPHGIIFSREAILENLLAQKKAIRRKLALWEAQQAGNTRKVPPQTNHLRL
jgi:nitric oxide synthase-interacting protein